MKSVKVCLFVVACMLPTVVSASMLSGGVTFNSTAPNVLVSSQSSVYFFGLPNAVVNAQDSSGTLGGVPAGTGVVIKNIMGSFPITDFLSYGGITINETSFSVPMLSIVTNHPGEFSVVDLVFNGIAHKIGFEDTPVLGDFTMLYVNGFNTQEVVSFNGKVNTILPPSNVPEPGGFVLLLCGVGSLALLHWRKGGSTRTAPRVSLRQYF